MTRLSIISLIICLLSTIDTGQSITPSNDLKLTFSRRNVTIKPCNSNGDSDDHEIYLNCGHMEKITLVSLTDHMVNPNSSYSSTFSVIKNDLFRTICETRHESTTTEQRDVSMTTCLRYLNFGQHLITDSIRKCQDRSYCIISEPFKRANLTIDDCSLLKKSKYELSYRCVPYNSQYSKRLIHMNDISNIIQCTDKKVLYIRSASVNIMLSNATRDRENNKPLIYPLLRSIIFEPTSWDHELLNSNNLDEDLATQDPDQVTDNQGYSYTKDEFNVLANDEPETHRTRMFRSYKNLLSDCPVLEFIPQVIFQKCLAKRQCSLSLHKLLSLSMKILSCEPHEQHLSDLFASLDYVCVDPNNLEPISDAYFDVGKINVTRLIDGTNSRFEYSNNYEELARIIVFFFHQYGRIEYNRDTGQLEAFRFDTPSTAMPNILTRLSLFDYVILIIFAVTLYHFTQQN